MREADIGCARYDACYDPPPLEWGWPEWALVFAIVLLVVWLLWLMTREPAKPEPPIRDAIADAVNNAKQEARNWNELKSVDLVDRLWVKVQAELTKRGL